MILHLQSVLTGCVRRTLSVYQLFLKAVGTWGGLRRDLVKLWSPPSVCAPGLWCTRCLCARYTYFVLEPVFSWSYNVCGGNYLCQYWVCSVSQSSTYTRNSWIVPNSRHFRLWFASALVISYKLCFIFAGYLQIWGFFAFSFSLPLFFTPRELLFYWYSLLPKYHCKSALWVSSFLFPLASFTIRFNY